MKFHTFNKLFAGLMTLGLLLPIATQAQSDWQFEITPYLWMAGIDGDVTAGGTTTEVDLDFDDLFDAVDAAFSVVMEAHSDDYFVGGQFDYLALDPDSAPVEVDITMFTLAAGKTFNLPFEGATLGIGPGVRYMNLETEVTAGGMKVKSEGDFVDGLLVLRPSIPITEKLRFNPALIIGAGDSDFTYDLWPNLQYMINDTWHTRVGYRTLYYDVADSTDSGFDGSIIGFFIGVGGRF